MKVHVVTSQLGYEFGLVGVYFRKQAAENALTRWVHGLEDTGGEIDMNKTSHGLLSYWSRGTGDYDDWQCVVVNYDVEIRR